MTDNTTNKPAKIYEVSEMSNRDNCVLNFLYNTLPGRVLLCLLISPVVSVFAGVVMDSPVSKIFIRNFIKRNRIDMEEYEDVKYKSFNDFFKREIKAGRRSFSDDARDVCAPCDGRLTAYNITNDSVFHIKNSAYSLDALLKDKKLADEFINGTCLIYRLTPNDYHRYAYIDGGQRVSEKKIKGVLHTVRPISQNQYKVFARNAREYEVIQTENFGKMVQMEIGALFIGRIANHKTGRAIRRGGEKGMFEFGGSSIVTLFQENAIVVDGAIIENTRRNLETIVKMGEVIGRYTPQRSGA